MPKKYSYYYVQAKVTVKLITEPEDIPAVSPSVSWNEEITKENKSENISLMGEEGESKVFNFIEGQGEGENPSPRSVIGKCSLAYYYLGIRLDSLLYQNEGLRNILGFYNIEFITSTERILTTKVIRNANNALALNVVDCYYVVFQAVDESLIYPQWGKEHKTYIYFDKGKDVNVLKQELLRYQLKVGPSEALYVLQGNSFKPRRLRKGVPQV